MGRVGQFQPPMAECKGSYSYRIPQQNSLTRGTWHLSKHGAPLWFAVRFSILQPACNTPGVPHSITFKSLGTQPSGSVGRAPQPSARVLSTIQSPFMTSIALLQAYSFDTQTCTGLKLFRKQEFIYFTIQKLYIVQYISCYKLPQNQNWKTKKTHCILVYLMKNFFIVFVTTKTLSFRSDGVIFNLSIILCHSDVSNSMVSYKAFLR